MKKCTLRGLEQRSDFNFFTYPTNRPFPIEDYILLTLDAPELTISDQTKGLLVLDGTWRYVQAMEQNLCLPSSLIGRSLPASLKTAYPRRQTDCSDPKRGLASIEAIVAAYSLLGRKIDGLLDNYYWKETFLEKNAFLCKT